jgi:hypothetical protein
MSDRLRARHAGLGLFVLLSFLTTSVSAKDLVSNRYGFQLPIPPGFREHDSDVSNLIAEYTESGATRGSYPITLDVRHTGSNYNAADKSAVSNLRSQKDWKATSQTRRWKDIDLQVVRRELAVSSTESYVNYAIVFPLKDEGVMLLVQGLKSREDEVAKVFDDTVRKFVNLKPYVTVVSGPMATDEGYSVFQVIANVLLPVATGVIVLVLFMKARKARAKTA